MRPISLLFIALLSLALAQTTYTVRPGDTLYRIAVNNNVTLEALQLLNNISDPSQLRVGQVLKISGKPAQTPLIYRSDLLPPIERLEWPAQVTQGNIAVLRFKAARAVVGKARFLDYDYDIVGNRVILPVPALQNPGLYPVNFTLGGQTTQITLKVVAGTFGRFVLQLPPDRAALLVPAKLRAERLKVIGACDPSRAQQWVGNFKKPVNTNRITDPFGTRRSYDKGKTYSFHEGLDYGVPEGTPVYAPAPGVVVLSQKLFVRGNGVVIDHGAGICSGFWHNSKLIAKVGQRVEAGTLISISGNTGLSNGPHSHFEIRVRGTPTNPAVWYFAAP